MSKSDQQHAIAARRRAAMWCMAITVGGFLALVAAMVFAPLVLAQVIAGEAVTLAMILAFAMLVADIAAIAFYERAVIRLEAAYRSREP